VARGVLYQFGKKVTHCAMTRCYQVGHGNLEALEAVRNNCKVCG
jgi:hypothetical protein